MRNIHRASAIGIAAVTAVILLAGCSTSAQPSGSAGSRVKFYSSVSELAGDSAVIVAGAVTAQRTATDIDPVTTFTISTVTVRSLKKGTALHPGSTLEVRQFGSATNHGPALLLAIGSEYLLYLTASGLSGPLASQYYVTGGNAGLYKAALPSTSDKDGASFTQMQIDKGDSLPTAVTLAGAAG